MKARETTGRGDVTMRDVKHRYRGLPPRTPEMLYNIVRKFYRGAVSHYDLIQEKKADVRAAWLQRGESGSDAALRQAMTTLFLEFHFYVTCWLQIERALYRLARQDERQAEVMERFRDTLEKHVKVRELLDETEACVQVQWQHDGPGLACVERDGYTFGDVTFTVDEQSLKDLHDLYAAIMAAREAQPSAAPTVSG
jgi:hypothetical protein